MAGITEQTVVMNNEVAAKSGGKDKREGLYTFLSGLKDEKGASVMAGRTKEDFFAAMGDPAKRNRLYENLNRSRYREAFQEYLSGVRKADNVRRGTRRVPDDGQGQRPGTPGVPEVMGPEAGLERELDRRNEDHRRAQEALEADIRDAMRDAKWFEEVPIYPYGTGPGGTGSPGSPGGTTGTGKEGRFWEGVKEGGKDLLAGAALVANKAWLDVLDVNPEDEREALGVLGRAGGVEAALREKEELEKEQAEAVRRLEAYGAGLPNKRINEKYRNTKAWLEKKYGRMLKPYAVIEEAYRANGAGAEGAIREREQREADGTAARNLEQNRAELSNTPELTGWAKLGSLIPQGAGTTAAILGGAAVTGLTGGSAAPVIAGAMSWGSAALLTASSGGQAMHERMKYAEERGYYSDNNGVWMTGVANMGAEALGESTGRLFGPVAKYMGRIGGKKAASISVEGLLRRNLTRDADGRMMREVEAYAKRNMPKVWATGVRMAKEAVKTGGEEAAEEVFTQVIQTGLMNAYVQGDDKVKGLELFDGAGDAALAGFLMGGMNAPAIRVGELARVRAIRKRNGGRIYGVVMNGEKEEAVEILGKDDEKGVATVIDRSGAEKEVKGEDVLFAVKMNEAEANRVEEVKRAGEEGTKEAVKETVKTAEGIDKAVKETESVGASLTPEVVTDAGYMQALEEKTKGLREEAEEVKGDDALPSPEEVRQWGEGEVADFIVNVIAKSEDGHRMDVLSEWVKAERALGRAGAMREEIEREAKEAERMAEEAARGTTNQDGDVIEVTLKGEDAPVRVTSGRKVEDADGTVRVVPEEGKQAVYYEGEDGKVYAVKSEEIGEVRRSEEYGDRGRGQMMPPDRVGQGQTQSDEAGRSQTKSDEAGRGQTELWGRLGRELSVKAEAKRAMEEGRVRMAERIEEKAGAVRELEGAFGAKAELYFGMEDFLEGVKDKAWGEKVAKAAGGEAVKGFTNPKTGEVYLLIGNHKDVRDVTQTFVHEVVVHKGVKELFEGRKEGGFGELLDAIWEGMTEAERGRMQEAYGEGDERLLAEEYMAELAEYSGNWMQADKERGGAFGRIVRAVKEAWRKVFGTGKKTPTLRASDAKEIAGRAIRESYERMRQEAEKAGAGTGRSGEAALAPAEKQKEDIQSFNGIISNTPKEELPKPVSTVKEWRKLFKESVRTPIKLIRVTDEVFNNITRRGRANISGAVKPTLEAPDFMLTEKDGTTLYVKGYKPGVGKAYYVVAVNKTATDEDYVSSVHTERVNTLRNKIKEGATLSLPGRIAGTADGGGLRDKIAPSGGKNSGKGGGVVRYESLTEEERAFIEAVEGAEKENFERVNGIIENRTFKSNTEYYRQLVSIKRDIKDRLKRFEELRVSGISQKELEGLRRVISRFTAEEYLSMGRDQIAETDRANKGRTTDTQGNKVDEKGRLVVEKLSSIDELTDEDFTAPYRSVELPEVPKNVDEAIGAGGKPVIIKKNIFEKNRDSHKDLTAGDGREIIQNALYNADVYGQNQKRTRPYNWILIHLADKSQSIIVEVSSTKDAIEIVNWHYLSGRQLEQKKRQAVKEGGRILTLESAVGNTLDSLSSDTKVAENAETKKRPSEERGDVPNRRAKEEDPKGGDGVSWVSPEVIGTGIDPDRVTFRETDPRHADILIDGKETGLYLFYDTEAHIDKNPYYISRVGLNFTHPNSDELDAYLDEQAKRGEVKGSAFNDDEGGLTARTLSDYAKAEGIMLKERPEFFEAIGAKEEAELVQWVVTDVNQSRVDVNENTGVRFRRQNSEEVSIAERAKRDGSYMKAPNGKPSNLSESQWTQVRTQAFKKWFGDWEKAARIEKLRKSEPVVLTGEEYKGKYELNRKSAHRWILDNLRGAYTVNDTNEEVTLSRVSANEVTAHGEREEIHLKSFAFIPQMLKHAIFIEEKENSKGNGKYDSYRYYVVGLKVGNTDYTARLVVGVKNGKTYYDHELTEIEKGDLINSLNSTTTAVAGNKDTSFGYKDKRLFELLQPGGVSKVVDENGEPMVVYHGTVNTDFNTFAGASFFTDDYMNADGYANGERVIEGFLSLRHPLIVETNGEKWDDLSSEYGNRTTDVVSKVVNEGVYDGVIFRGINDSWMDDEEGDISTVYVAIAPNQIKSATENVGTFDAGNEDIRFRKAEEEAIVRRAKRDGSYMKAPNGKPSNLNERQWTQVRTQAFKKWFGDWEKAARIEKLRTAEPVVLTGGEYKGKYELNRDSAKQWAMDNLRGEYHIKDTNEDIKVLRVSVNKIASHGEREEIHLKSFAFVPQMVENALFIDEVENKKGNNKYDSYRYYAVGLNVGGADYTARLTLGVKDNVSYYDHELTEIEKGKLLDSLNSSTNAETGKKDASFGYKDKRLFELLQTGEVSKVVDENGEPMVVYHGTRVEEDFFRFDPKSIGRRWGLGVHGEGFYFTNSIDTAISYGFNVRPFFVNIRHPFDRKIEVNAGNGVDKYFTKKIQKKGYDGVIGGNSHPWHKGDGFEFVAFSPNQIKSATENVGTFDGTNDDIRFRKEDLDEVNRRFNEDLAGLTEETKDKTTLYLGFPNGVLQRAGVLPKQMKLYGAKLWKKKTKHGFSLSELRDLPKAVADPIAVFNNYDSDVNRTILTELRTKAGNFVVAVELGKGVDENYNLVLSVFGKSDHKIVEWLNKGYATYINKAKALSFLSYHPAPIAGASANEELSRATKVVENFENAKYLPGVRFRAAYHGSPYAFEQFELNDERKTNGRGYGYGVYVTEREELGKRYAKNGYLYEVEIPDGRYLDLDGRAPMIDDTFVDEVISAAEKTGNLKGGDVRAEVERYLEDIPSGSSLYEGVSQSLGSEKAASQFFLEHGYKGSKYTLHNINRERFVSYVIFNPDDVKAVLRVDSVTGEEVRFRKVSGEEEAIAERAKRDGSYMKAPNGKPSNLSERQWTQVRTKAFKKWFGDWEKAARIEKLRTAEPVVITGNEVAYSEGLKAYKKNALAYGKTLRANYTCRDTQEVISLSKDGIKEVLQHDYKDKEQLQSVAAIPQLIEKAIYISSSDNEDVQKHPRIEAYRYYVAGLKIGATDYTARLVVAVDHNGNRFYDHKLTHIEKGHLLDAVAGITNPTLHQKDTLSGVKDTKLLSLLQVGEVSKVVDENGEPMVVYHNTDAEFSIFDLSKVRRNMDVQGFYFSDSRDEWDAMGVKQMKLFLNIRNPRYDKPVPDLSQDNAGVLVREKLRSKGYDGIISHDEETETKEYVAFSPNQIKSATDNVGTFDGTNDDIRFRRVSNEEAQIAERAKRDGSYMKAPNGKPSNLNERQWTQVRTKAFKEWFGDWEKAARIEKLRTAEPVVLTGKEYEGKYELNRDSAKQFIKDKVRGTYRNADTGDLIDVTGVGANKVTSHGMGNESHLKSIAAIPSLIERSVFIEERESEKKDSKYDSYRYYVVGLRIGGEDYTVKLTIGLKQGVKYYDHSLTQIEKGRLLDLLNSQVAYDEGFTTTGDAPIRSSALSRFKDTKLISLLQVGEVSKVVDENGEPMVVYHGTGSEFYIFDTLKIGSSTGTADGRGFYFTSDKSYAHAFGKDGNVMSVFLNIRNPLNTERKTITKKQLFEILKRIDEKEYAADGEHWLISNYGNYYTDGIENVIKEATKSEYEFSDTDVELVNALISASGDFNVVMSSVYEVTGKASEIVPKNNGTTHYVITAPNQIKSATENVGTFDVGNGDIRFRVQSEEEATHPGVVELRGEEALTELEEIFSKRVPESLPKQLRTIEDYRLEFLNPVVTPISVITVNADNVYKKGDSLRRHELSGGIRPTLEHPDAILRDYDGSILYAKLYNRESGGGKQILVVHKEPLGGGYIASFHDIRDRQLIRKIEKGASILRVSADGFGVETRSQDKAPYGDKDTKQVSHVQTGGETDGNKEKGGAFGGDVAKFAREVAREDLEEVNRKFNEGLEGLTEETANRVRLNLGMPSEALLRGGVTDRPMLLYGNKLIWEAKKHGYSASDLKDLPKALANPIAVFQTQSGKDSHAVLTELKSKDGNFLVALKRGVEGNVELNIVSSVYGKGAEKVVGWIVEGKGTYYNKKKAQDYLASIVAPIAGASQTSELSRAVKVVKEFESSKAGGEIGRNREEGAAFDGDIAKLAREVAGVAGADGVGLGRTDRTGSREDLEGVRGDKDEEVLFRKTRELPKFVAEDADGDIAALSKAVVHNAEAGRAAGKLIRGEFAKLGSGYRQLYAKFVDANAGLEKLYQTLEETGIKPKAGENAYTHLQTSNGRALYLASEYKHKVSEPLTKFLQGIVKGTDADLFRGYELTFYDDDGEVTTRTEADAYRVLGLYLSAKDIVESETLGLVGRGRSGFEESVSRGGAGVKPEEMVRAIEEAIGEAKTKELWDKIRGISKWVFDLQLSHGYISREVYDKYVNGERKYYVPQRGWASRSEEEEPTLFGMRKRGVSGGVRNTALKEAKGRESLADNPLQAFESIVQTTIDEVLKNDSKRAFYRFFLSNERKLRDMGLFGVKRVYTVKKVRGGETVRNEAGETEYEATYDAPSAEMLEEDKKRREKIRGLKKRVTALRKEDLAAERSVDRGVLTTEEVQSEREAIRRDLERVQEAIAGEEGELNVKEGGSEAPRLRDMTPMEKQKQTVALLEGGKKYELVFEKPYAEVAAALNRDYGEGSKGEWGAYLSRVTKWMSGMMTRYNPAFGVANGFRDFFAAVIYNGARFGGKYSARYLRNIGRTSGAVLRYSLYDVFGVTDARKLYGEGEIGKMMHSYIKNGGPTGWSFMRDPKEIRKDLKEAISPTRLEAMKNGGKEAAESVLGLLSFISEASELEMRFAEYVTSLEEVDEAGRAKYTEEEAIQHSKEVTTNFDRKGILRRWASYFYAFWNASIQGVNGIFKVAEDHGGKAKAAIWTTFVLLLNGGFVSTLMGLGDDDDERDEWTEWDRMNNLCLPGGWKVPLPQTYRSMWGFGVQMALFVKGRKEPEHALIDGFKYATGQFLPSNVSAVIDAAEYNPVRGQVEYDFPRALTGALVPTMLVPEAELGTNTDFMGNSIYNTPFMLKQDGLVARSSLGKRNAYAFEGITDALFEAGGGTKGSRSALKRDDSGRYVPYLLDINPNVLKHLFTGHFGGLGTTVVGIADNVRRVTNGRAFDLNMIPYFSSITQRGKDYGDREVALWELKSYLEQYGEDWRVMKKEDPERYREVSLMPENPYGRNTPEYAEYMAEHGTNLQKRYDAWRRGEELVKRAEAGELSDAEVKEASRDLQREFRETR